MNKERMLMLADVLDKVKPMQFNMGDWFSVYVGDEDYAEEDIYYEDSDVFRTNTVMQMNGYNCDAAACIAGWAVVLKNDFAVNNPNTLCVNSSSRNSWDERLAAGELPVMQEAKEYLELTVDQSIGLFLNEDGYSVWQYYAGDLGIKDTRYISLNDITPKMAAMALRNLANEKWKFPADEH